AEIRRPDAPKIVLKSIIGTVRQVRPDSVLAVGGVAGVEVARMLFQLERLDPAISTDDSGTWRRRARLPAHPARTDWQGKRGHVSEDDCTRKEEGTLLRLSNAFVALTSQCHNES